jgi:lipopolysaccharide transport system ATP-binding protein
MSIVISVENLSKTYRLGQIGTGTFTNDMRVWWAKMRGQTNPMLRIGEQEHGNRDSDNLYALRDVSFRVEQGELLGIIGRNGAGKSTLLKILSRVTAPTSGEIKVKGRIASLLEVGTGFHPDLTGRENIYLNGAILGMTRGEIRRRFDEILDFSGVEKFVDTPVKRYSSGMYVRMAFAVAAHLDPDILVVDEVLAVGDVAFQKKCLGKMQDVSKDGRTVLFVSHNMDAVENLTKSCLWLENGEILKYSTTPEIVSSYLRFILRETMANDGFQDLTKANRRADFLGMGKMQFAWIRICDNNLQPKNVFFEGVPIKVLVSFEIKDEVSDFRIGCSVNHDGFELSLFTIASELLTFKNNGKYVMTFSIDPNYLRSGSYTLDLKAFINGARCDHIAAIKFSMVENPEKRSNLVEKWIAGPLSFDYRWSYPENENNHAADK